MQTLLLIEDEAAIADTILYALRTEGFAVEWFRLGHEGLARLRQGGVDLVVLDVGLPDANGFELCKVLRGFSQVPLIFLTARADEIDRIVGLEIGGDDYVTKPFSPRELAARIKVILKRRVPSAGPSPVEAPATTRHGFEQSPARAEIRLDGQPLPLTRYEYLILQLLLAHPGRVWSRAQIMDQVWDTPEASFERAVDTHIKTLRAKLRAVRDAELIRTHRGLGYSLTVDG